MFTDLLPVWEVFDTSTGRTIGYARALEFETAIRDVSTLSDWPNRKLDTDLVPIDRLDTLPTALPASIAPPNRV